MRVFRIGAGLTALFLLGMANAHAYLDPGTGSAILQGILGALAALAVALKLYWHRFLRLLGLRKKLEDPEQAQHGDKQSSVDQEGSKD